MENSSKIFAIVAGLAALVFSFAFIISAVMPVAPNTTVRKQPVRQVAAVKAPVPANTVTKMTVSTPTENVVKQSVFVK